MSRGGRGKGGGWKKGRAKGGGPGGGKEKAREGVGAVGSTWGRAEVSWWGREGAGRERRGPAGEGGIRGCGEHQGLLLKRAGGEVGCGEGGRWEGGGAGAVPLALCLCCFSEAAPCARIRLPRPPTTLTSTLLIYTAPCRISAPAHLSSRCFPELNHGCGLHRSPLRSPPPPLDATRVLLSKLHTLTPQPPRTSPASASS